LTPGLRPEEPVGTRDIGITFPDVIQAGIGTLRLAMQRAIGLFQYPSIPRDLTRHGGTCANRQDAGGAGDQARSQPAARIVTHHESPSVLSAPYGAPTRNCGRGIDALVDDAGQSIFATTIANMLDEAHAARFPLALAVDGRPATCPKATLGRQPSFYARTGPENLPALVPTRNVCVLTFELSGHLGVVGAIPRYCTMRPPKAIRPLPAGAYSMWTRWAGRPSAAPMAAVSARISVSAAVPTGG
jgi:hypothetical protein